MSKLKFLSNSPRFLFFTGKGGVGKTSLACAAAISLADSGLRVLLVSTDPASNVGQVFGIAIGNNITLIPNVPRLSALEIDPQAAAQAYRDKFTGLLVDSNLTADYDHIVFDTAPTGHTIRLLQLPGAWNDFLEEGKGDASCLGPLAGLEKQHSQYKSAVDSLADPKRSRLILVARAQKTALREAARTHEELAAIGLTKQFLVIAASRNGAR